MRGAPHNSFVIDSTMQTTIELSGIMPSRSTDLYIDMSVGDGNIEPAYVTGFINYAVYEGDTIENVNPVRFVVNRAEARLD